MKYSDAVNKWKNRLIVFPLLLAILFTSACASSAPMPPATYPAQGGSSGPYQPMPPITVVVPAAEPGFKWPWQGGASAPAYPINPQPGSGSNAPYSYPNSGDGTIGLAVGGAKDIGNFRENIDNKYLPLPSDVTYEGLFYDYYFDTGRSEVTNKLFAPAYSFAVTRDPFSGAPEYYMSVGLNSGLRESDFARKKLNLVVVLDISGSMDADFQSYYYDASGRKPPVYEPGQASKKIAVAKDAIISILDQLTPDDRLGVVCFNDRAYVTQPLTSLREDDLWRIKDRIRNIGATGGTNLSAGMAEATNMLAGYPYIDPSIYENRIIYLTDAMPNTGDYSEGGLMWQTTRNADNRIYSTFIGIGVDFNSSLVEYITKTKGANYYSVHTPGEFRERMDKEFECMVTPIVFDVVLRFESGGWDIEKVYGSPEANFATGELMRINTLFPAPKSDSGETKGGITILKLKKRYYGGDIRLRVSYEDRLGRKDYSEVTVPLEATSPEYFQNSGIRKGVLLVRYANLLQNWLTDERMHASSTSSMGWEPRVSDKHGIGIPNYTLSTWERTSLPLTVSKQYKSVFADFRRYFRDEANALGDSTLSQELDILDKLDGFNLW